MPRVACHLWMVLARVVPSRVIPRFDGRFDRRRPVEETVENLCC